MINYLLGLLVLTELALAYSIPFLTDAYIIRKDRDE